MNHPELKKFSTLISIAFPNLTTVLFPAVIAIMSLSVIALITYRRNRDSIR